MSYRTFCEILSKTCSNQNDANCGDCPISRQYLEELATRYRANDPHKKPLKFVELSKWDLSLRIQAHRTSLVSVRRGTVKSQI